MNSRDLDVLAYGFGLGLTAAILVLLFVLASTAAAAPVLGGTADDPPDCSCAAWLCG